MTCETSIESVLQALPVETYSPCLLRAYCNLCANFPSKEQDSSPGSLKLSTSGPFKIKANSRFNASNSFLLSHLMLLVYGDIRYKRVLVPHIAR